jgi:hypothetical protein
MYHCTIDLLFDWFGLDFMQIKTNIVSCHTADSKPVKQEVNGTMILPPLVFPGWPLPLLAYFRPCRKGLLGKNGLAYSGEESFM